ncbi:MAG: MarR family transcriptional regulator [Erysipelotrichaceae bacterium]|nr:MarR family transcriptional regulator [Erysipelotrichaceae bacterium]
MNDNQMIELFDALERIYLRNLVQDDLTIAESIALHVIFQLGSPTIIELAKALQISQSNATYLIHKLENRGYLIRERSQEDRREYHLAVTDKFEKVLNSTRSRLRDAFAEELNRCQGADQKTIQDFYREVLRNVQSGSEAI